MNLNDANRINDAAPDGSDYIYSLQEEALSLIMKLSDKQLEQAIRIFLEGEKNEHIKKAAG